MPLQHFCALIKQKELDYRLETRSKKEKICYLY